MKRALAPKNSPGRKHDPTTYIKKKCPHCFAKDRGRHHAVQEINQFSLWCYRCGTKIVHRFNDMGQVGQRPIVDMATVRSKARPAWYQNRKKLSPVGSVLRRIYIASKLQRWAEEH